jgi:glycosyltransferase involved in cell wall biosynthesis
MILASASETTNIQGTSQATRILRDLIAARQSAFFQGDGMRVLMILPHPVEGPSSRFRAYQYLPFLEASGMEITVRPFLSSRLMPQLYTSASMTKKLAFAAYGAMQRLTDTVRARRYDVVYVLREAFPFGPPLLENLLAAAAGRFVFDFDDAIYSRSFAYSNPLDRLRDWSKTGKILGKADKIIAGSEYLAAYAGKFNSDDRIHVLPTVVDPNVYLPDADRENRPGVTIGWIGTPRGSAYLKDLKPAFHRLCSMRKDASFVFVGAEPFDPEGLQIEFRHWSLEREAADVGSFDIGIMPLTDDEETRGKCGFKLIQYMSAEVTPVCSPVGANLNIVQHGVTGLFASSADEWAEGLMMLADHPDARRSMGRAGRNTVIERFSLGYAAPRFRDILLATGMK